MRYASVRELDISNGESVGVALFVQGCSFHCKNCFNSETWDFNGGKEWTEETKNEFLKLASKPFIKRISILGGEPLAKENLNDVLKLVNEIRILLPNKTIWLYTGFKWEDIIYEQSDRYEIIKQCDIIVDGQYIDELRDFKLKWRGSLNQRVIDTKKSLEQNKIVLYCD